MLWEELLEAMPALLVWFLFQALLPLRMLFIRTRINRPILFVIVATLILATFRLQQQYMRTARQE